jgi:diacylglycerol kinase (ATP)
MHSAVLLYNPLSGNHQEKRRQQIDAVREVLRNARVETECFATRSGPDATAQARQAVAAGYDTVFACGGDGTINDVLQGLVGTQTALAVIPMGTANSLAHDLGLPIHPTRALRAALSGVSRRIAVGKIEYQDLAGNPAARYFTVTAGIGVDALLFRKLDPLTKRHLGMVSYYAKATYLWLTHRMKEFSVEFVDAAGTKSVCADVTQLLAVRIRNFGGILRELAPGASLDRDDMRLVLFRTKNRLAYLQYVIRGILSTNWKVEGIESAYSGQVICGPSNSQIFVEVDGELLGTLPGKISIVANAVSILTPK